MSHSCGADEKATPTETKSWGDAMRKPNVEYLERHHPLYSMYLFQSWHIREYSSSLSAKTSQMPTGSFKTDAEEKEWEISFFIGEMLQATTPQNKNNSTT